MDAIETLKQWVSESRRMVAFTGAGVSTESGIPDFRSVDGLYNQKFEYPPETIISHSFYLRRPEYFFRFYREKMMPLDVEPNITQKAGSQRVYELHGSILRNYCVKCGKFYPAEFVKNCESIPRCTCGGIVKPDVVLYEEGLNDKTVEGALEAIQEADMLLVAGTSLTVYPAAGFLRYYRGNRLVLINRDPTPYDDRADLVIHDSLGNVLSQL